MAKVSAVKIVSLTASLQVRSPLFSRSQKAFALLVSALLESDG